MGVLFKNAEIITENGIMHGDLLTCGNKICAMGESLPYSENAVTIDACSQYLSPGFIDIHTHGGGGADFMDGNAESIYRACAMHLRHGTTTIIPTTIAGSQEDLLECLRLFETIELTRQGMPEILGIHLEGPYFAYEQRGAQDPQYLRNPDPKEYGAAFAASTRIKRWSFAVELPGSDEFLQALLKHNVIASVAHSDASCAQVRHAHECGAAALAHFYSGMSGVKRVNAFRVAGAIEAGYLLDDLYVEVIADGCHLPQELLQLIYKIKGADRICLVTDSMRAAGMPDGMYVLGALLSGVQTIVEDGVAKLPDRTAFAGSVATADRLVRTMYALSGAPLHETIKMASLTPARLMKIDGRKGSLKVGKDADILLLDKELNVNAVMARGEMIK
ncbi:MAG: N-acetylglucosamine-6-phosphate deacetylase [Oscillospiraceae bacterium]